MGEESSHKQVLKSTAITGGSQILVIFAGIIRTKILAVLLGPIGVGLAGIYQVIADMVKSLCGLGIGFSAVKTVAEADATGDKNRLANKKAIVRRWSIYTGILSVLVMVALAKPISQYTFGNSDHATSIILLSIMVFLMQLTTGQLAILQGTRKIGAMAKANVIGAALGLAFVIPVFYVYKIDGIVPSMIIIAAISWLLSLYFTRSADAPPVSVTADQTLKEGRKMLLLGLFTVFAGFIELATMYLVREFVADKSGLDAMGQFIAAWSISTMYLSVALGAMAADYFPRLSSAGENSKINRLVNEQLDIALLLICPLIVGLISFVHMVVHIFYTTSFSATPGILYWQLVGDFFKIFTWVFMYVLLAKGRKTLYVLLTLLWSGLYLGSVYGGWEIYGLKVTGIAFAASYFIVALLTVLIAARFMKIHLTGKTLQFTLVFGFLIAISLLSHFYLDEKWQLAAGSGLTLLCAFYSFSQLRRLIDFRQFFFRKLSAKEPKNNTL